MARASSFDYQTYLASREWSLLRERVRERSGNTCEHCFGAPQQAVHHLTYERIGQENLADLLAVCHPCHEFLSGKSDENPLLDSYVVSSVVGINEFWPEGKHFILPLRSGMAARRERCTGQKCLWCNYRNDDWPLFVPGLVRP